MAEGASGAGDRRAGTRVEALVVVKLGRDKLGVTRNASERGLLIATRSRMSVGDRLELVIGATTGQIPVQGRVVRVDEPKDAEWRYLVAVDLDETLPRDVLEHGQEAAGKLLRQPARPPTSRVRTPSGKVRTSSGKLRTSTKVKAKKP